MQTDINSRAHWLVLQSLKGQKIKDLEFRIEEPGGRLDLPNPKLFAKQKDPGQRKKNLCYTDAILPANDLPRVLVEIVDSSPKSPNGITGLTINADRVASFYKCELDLIFVVLAEDMKRFSCRVCQNARGHKLSNHRFIEHFQKNWTPELMREEILHHGLPMQFRKALKDYAIQEYLKALRPPSVMFLSKKKILHTWEEYRATALEKITHQVKQSLEDSSRDSVQFSGIEELLPDEFKQHIQIG
jgi:hypothetical protein